MTLTLRDIDRHNLDAVCELPLPDEQQRHLSPNVWSIAESHYHDEFQPRGIYRGEEPVGFIMWVHLSPSRTSIWRFMIAEPHQRQGIGRTALKLALDTIARDPAVREIEICYSPKNLPAKQLYASEGFIEIGLDEDGDEMHARITLSRTSDTDSSGSPNG